VPPLVARQLCEVAPIDEGLQRRRTPVRVVRPIVDQRRMDGMDGSFRVSHDAAASVLPRKDMEREGHESDERKAYTERDGASQGRADDERLDHESITTSPADHSSSRDERSTLRAEKSSA
jgi:hypothetical protein